jgi:hypothetical protein
MTHNNNLYGVVIMTNLGFGLGSLAIEAVFGYAGAALFTTINPVIGALFGCTSSVITSITKAIFEKANWGTPAIKSIAANALGILGGAGVVALVAGTTLTPMVALGLFISIVAAKIIFSLSVLIISGCLIRSSAS